MNITGGDSLFLQYEANINDIDVLLKNCYNVYFSNKYKEHFGWIDNNKEERNKSTIKLLEEKTVEMFQKKNYDLLWLAVPEFINLERVAGFKIDGQQDKNQLFEDITVEMLEKLSLNKPLSYDEIKDKEIRAISVSDLKNFEYKWKLSKCIVGNIDFEGKSFAINNGKWYSIDQDFVANINKQYREIEISHLEFIDYLSSFKDEPEYNHKLINNIPKYRSLHEVFHSIGGGRGNKIESVTFIMTSILSILKNQHLLHI